MPSSDEFKQPLQLPIEGRISRTNTPNPVAGMKDPRIGGILPKQESLNAYKGLYWGVMAFFVFSYLRPQDIIRPLQAVHPIVILVPVLIIGYLLSSKTAKLAGISPFIKALLVFNGVMILSIPFSFYHGKSFEGASDFLFTIVLICFLITIVFNTFRRIERLFLMLNFGIVILALDIIRKYLSGQGHGEIHGLISAQFENPNDLGVNFVLFLPMIYYYFLSGKDTFTKLFSLALFGVVLFGVLGTQSRGAELGAAVVLGLLIMKTERKALALISGTLVLVVILALAPGNALKRFGTIFTFAQGKGENTEEYGNAETRTWFYESSLRMAFSRPFTGVGMGAWPRAYALEFRNPEDTSNRWPDPHSSFFQIIGELGLPGIITYLYLIYLTLSAIKSLEMQFKGNPDYRRQLYFVQCLRIGFIGFLISTIFQSFSYYPTGYNMMAVVFAMERIYHNNYKKSAAPVGRLNGKQA
jgi:probable O-glycosylation ligase (exosortase A-associated)